MHQDDQHNNGKDAYVANFPNGVDFHVAPVPMQSPANVIPHQQGGPILWQHGNAHMNASFLQGTSPVPPPPPPSLVQQQQQLIHQQQQHQPQQQSHPQFYNEYLYNNMQFAGPTTGQPEAYSATYLPVGRGNFLKVYHCADNINNPDAPAGIFQQNTSSYQPAHQQQPPHQQQPQQQQQQPQPQTPTFVTHIPNINHVPTPAPTPSPNQPQFYELFASNPPITKPEVPQQQQQQQNEEQTVTTTNSINLANGNGSNMLINNLVNNWSPNLTSGTYTQFGDPKASQQQQQQQQSSSVEPSTLGEPILAPQYTPVLPILPPLSPIKTTNSDTTTANKLKPSTTSLLTQNATAFPEAKKRIVAEVKPMRLSYSEVLSNTVKPGPGTGGRNTINVEPIVNQSRNQALDDVVGLQATRSTKRSPTHEPKEAVIQQQQQTNSGANNSNNGRSKKRANNIQTNGNNNGNNQNSNVHQKPQQQQQQQQQQLQQQQQQQQSAQHKQQKQNENGGKKRTSNNAGSHSKNNYNSNAATKLNEPNLTKSASNATAQSHTNSNNHASNNANTRKSNKSTSMTAQTSASTTYSNSANSNNNASSSSSKRYYSSSSNSNSNSNSGYSYSSKRNRNSNYSSNSSTLTASATNHNYELLKRILLTWWTYTLKLLTWLFYLVYDIVVLGCSMAYERLTHAYISGLAYAKQLHKDLKQNSGKPSIWWRNYWRRFDARFKKDSRWAFWRRFYKKKPPESTSEPFKSGRLPQTGEEAMYSLLNCKGKDAYSILGVPPDSSQEQIRKHYKKIAVLVHPDKNKQAGAEEAFKVLQRAFELIGEPENRVAYDQSLAEALHAEKAWTELHDLLSQLQTKITEAANTIRCSTCAQRHPRKLTDRPHFAARECSSCKIRHPAKEGDIWAETSMFGLRWKYLALMEGKVYDITEWANCQKGALSHLEPNSHVVQYRIVRGAQQQQQQQQQQHQHQQQAQQQQQQQQAHGERGSSAGGGNPGGKFKRDIPPSEALHEFLDNLYSGQNPNQPNPPPFTSGSSRRRTRRN